MENSDFLHTYSKIILLSSFLGFYFPGASRLLPFGKNFDLFFYYCIMLCCLFVFAALDIMTVTIINIDVYPFFNRFFNFLISFSYVWFASYAFYNLYCWKMLEKIIHTWNRELKPVLWPDLRQAALEHQHSLTTKKYIRVIGLLGPLYVVRSVLLGLKGEILFPSTLGIGAEPKAKFPQLLIPHLCSTSIIIHYMTSQCLRSFFMRTVISEFDYLRACLEKILAEPDSDETYLPHKETKANLILFVKYHNTVIRYSKHMCEFMGPSVALEMFFIVITICSAGYSVSTGKLTFKMTLIISFAICINTSYFLFNCRIGDEVREKGSAIADIAYGGNWRDCNVEIRKIILSIIRISVHKEINISIFNNMFSLTSVTFQQLIIQQYRFFRFMLDEMEY